MKPLYLLGIIYVGLSLTACTTTPTPTSKTHCTQTAENDYVPPDKIQNKDPINVSIINKTYPSRPYKVLGQVKVPKFNDHGIKRQEATLRDLMRQYAASLGGDALIDVKHGSREVTGRVIAYKQVLV